MSKRGLVAAVAVYLLVTPGCGDPSGSTSTAATPSRAKGTDDDPVPSAKELGLKRPTSRVVRGEGWAIAAPEDWSEFAAIRPPMVLFLAGDRRTGIPPTDGTLAALQAGLTVEVHVPEAGLSPRGRAERDLGGLAGSAGFEVQGEPLIREAVLADGTKVVRVRVEVLRRPRRRLSRYEKAYCATPDGRHVVASGFLACSPGGGPFLEKTGLANFVAAHVDSLCLDAGRVDQGKLGAAAGALDLLAGAALTEAGEGNRLLMPGAYDRAAKHFLRAIRLCDAVAAAHNGLAWALLQDEGAKGTESAEALRHAEAAVGLTSRRDPAALDTLALAYSRRGEREKAIAAIREAIQLNPDDPDLRRSLEKYEKG